MDLEKYLKPEERQYYDCDFEGSGFSGYDLDDLLRSRAASRRCVEELRTHIKMEGHGETVAMTHEEGCHMCRALARTEADFMEAE